jgi:hypothetical protein
VRDSFEFQKRGQLFIRSHNEALSVVAMGSNEDRSSLEIYSYLNLRDVLE